MRCTLTALLFLSLVGCGKQEVAIPPPGHYQEETGLIDRAEVADRIEDSLSVGSGPLPQRDRAILQFSMALGELEEGEFQTHYDWNGTELVTADWSVRPETRFGAMPSNVLITVPKTIDEVNIAAAASNAVGDPPLGVFRYSMELFPDLLGQAMEHGAARSDGFRCWQFDCTTEGSDETHWRFAIAFAPVAEGFERDEMQANVEPAE